MGNSATMPGTSRRAALGVAMGAVLGTAALAGTRGGGPRAAPRGTELSAMTWMEIRDAVAAGTRTVIVPSGGIEQNGPHMVTGKHDLIVAWAARRIAAELGDALVAPVVSYVPEGGFDPPSGNLAWPGTIGVPEATYEAVLDGIARSLRGGGFTAICLICDHGGSAAPQARLAARLNAEWRGGPARVIDVDRYYGGDSEAAYLRAQGETGETIGDHAGLIDTCELMAVRPDAVDLRGATTDGSAGLRADGSSGAPGRARMAWGDALLEARVAAAVAQIRAARAGTGHLAGVG